MIYLSIPPGIGPEVPCEKNQLPGPKTLAHNACQKFRPKITNL